MKARLLSGHRWWAALAVALMSAVARNAHACATCGLSAEDPKAHAYLSSVIFMIGAPYSIFVIGVLVAFFAYRNARRHRMEHEVSPPAP
jgi:H+/gluconate symporter-like permease